jgi:hypothetical protein
MIGGPSWLTFLTIFRPFGFRCWAIPCYVAFECRWWWWWWWRCVSQSPTILSMPFIRQLIHNDCDGPAHYTATVPYFLRKKERCLARTSTRGVLREVQIIVLYYPVLFYAALTWQQGNQMAGRLARDVLANGFGARPSLSYLQSNIHTCIHPASHASGAPPFVKAQIIPYEQS